MDWKRNRFWNLTDVSATANFLRSPPVIFAVALFFGLIWLEHFKDPYERTFSKIAVHGTNVVVISVTPKKLAPPYATVIYLHGDRGNALSNGRVLRQFADAGFAAVTMEYAQGDQDNFDQEMPALLSWIQKQGWSDTNRLAWVGFSRGAQQMLEYYIHQPGQSPNVMIRIGGGLVDCLKDEAKSVAIAPKHLGEPQVFLFHGEHDRIFPLSDVQKLVEWFRTKKSMVSTWVLPAGDHAFGADREWVMRCVIDQTAVVMSIPRTSSRPFGRLLTMKIALASILIFLIGWIYPKLVRFQAGVSLRFRLITLGAIVVALLVAIYCLILPRVLSAGKCASWFKHDLDTDAEQVDFLWLASLPDYQGMTCYQLMDQIRPSHFRKSFLYHELDEKMFRNYVLNPRITSDENPEMDWRWPFWLELYPKVRKCTTSEQAADIVLRVARERLGLPKGNAPDTDILTMWWTEQAKPQAYQRILVAALRSTGVASRLDSNGHAEFWTGQKWKTVIERDNPFVISSYSK